MLRCIENGGRRRLSRAIRTTLHGTSARTNREGKANEARGSVRMVDIMVVILSRRVVTCKGVHEAKEDSKLMKGRTDLPALKLCRSCDVP